MDTNFASGAQVNLACFQVAGRMHAIEVSQVREIVRMQQITPLPLSPELIEGVIDLRDRVIPVIDLGTVLDGHPIERDDRSRVVILDCDGLVLGLCVEDATDVLSVDASALEDVPDLAAQAGYEAVRHVVRRPNASPVMVLSLEHILARVYQSALPDSAVATEGV